MAAFSKIDWRAVYQEMARRARSRAEAADDPILQSSWATASESWDQLARLRFQTCFCGRAAIGCKYYTGNERMPYCGDHLIEAIAQDVLGRMNIRRIN